MKIVKSSQRPFPKTIIFCPYDLRNRIFSCVYIYIYIYIYICMYVYIKNKVKKHSD